MLEGLARIPWKDLANSDDVYTFYESVEDLPIYLRQLLSTDSQERSSALRRLYENLLHQGTRCGATPYVIPFMIELCGEPSVSNRASLLYFWGHAITSYFSIRERPWWGDGERIYYGDKIDEISDEYDLNRELHDIYRESLKGQNLLYRLLEEDQENIRGGAVWVLACLPTIAESSIPKLIAKFEREKIDWIRGVITFALGELGASTKLREILTKDKDPATRCIAACQLARIAPQDDLIDPLLNFASNPIEDYQNIPGTGGRSTDDAAFAISYLPLHLQQQAIPAICQRLKQARDFETVPLVKTLLSAAFEQRDTPLTELTDIQKLVLGQLVITDELWTIGNLFGVFGAYGLPDGLADKKEKCAKLLGIELTPDNALTELRSGLTYAQMNFLPQARASILKAIEIDSTVFDRVPTPEVAWLLYAEAFAEVDYERSLFAYRKAYLINSAIAKQVSPKWYLSRLLQEQDF
ncbi:MAG: hypothetical protein AAFO76_15080 [Cyanobacteria bacterium J06607_15]